MAAESLKTLLAGLIDYAGLFPPAALNMETTVRNYATYRAGPFAWALGALIVPVGRLEEFLRFAKPYASEAEIVWPVSLLVGAELEALKEIVAVTAEARGWRAVALEVRPETPDFIPAAVAATPPELRSRTFFEIPPSSDPSAWLQAVKRAGACAKIRTGGVTADAFPAPDDIAHFLETCAEFDVPFKATAGLHHPMRAVNRLTYEPECDSAVMHGFLNVFLAAAFLRNGMTTENAVKVLEERDAENFRFTAAGLAWHCQELSRAQLAEARRDFCLSFGSCSFDEPIADLRKLTLL